MPECDYCGESFGGEDDYLEHLHGDHDEGELSRIDRRRVEQYVGDEDDGEFPTGPAIIAGLLLVTVAVLAYLTFFVGGTATGGQDGVANVVAKTPSGVGTVHEHGTIDVVIDGRELDFGRSAFQHPRQSPAFHFEGGVGEVWHKHARGVTLEYAMATLDIAVNETAVTFQGTTYRDSDPGTEVIVRVNGEPVDPETYVLQGVPAQSGEGGDHVRIVVRTNASDG